MSIKIKYFLVITLLFYCFTVNAQNKTVVKSNSNMEAVETFKFKHFINKQFYNLLVNDTIRNYKELIYSDDRPGVLSSVIIKINSKYEIEIFFNELLYTKSFNENQDWDFYNVIKENISIINLYKNGKKIKTFQ